MTSRIMQNALLACLVAALVSAVCAQETRSTIFGRVTDPHNSAVAGATVVVTNADTNTSMTLTTNETGYYEANLLISGNYRMAVEKPGFRKLIRSGIGLPISARVEIAFYSFAGRSYRQCVGDSGDPLSRYEQRRLRRQGNGHSRGARFANLQQQPADAHQACSRNRGEQQSPL